MFSGSNFVSISFLSPVCYISPFVAKIRFQIIIIIIIIIVVIDICSSSNIRSSSRTKPTATNVPIEKISSLNISCYLLILLGAVMKFEDFSPDLS